MADKKNSTKVNNKATSTGSDLSYRQTTVKENLENSITYYSNGLAKATITMAEYNKNPEVHEALHKVRN